MATSVYSYNIAASLDNSSHLALADNLPKKKLGSRLFDLTNSISDPASILQKRTFSNTDNLQDSNIRLRIQQSAQNGTG